MTQFQTAQPMAAFPQLLYICAERIADPSYRYEGRFRKSEGHCLFKFTLAGEGRFRSGKKTYRLPAGRGFLCEVNDPATAYYYPEDGREPWEFVYLCFAGPAGISMTREFARKYGHVFQLPPETGYIPEIMAWQRYDRRAVRIMPAEGARIVAGLFAVLAQGRAGADKKDEAGFVLAREAQRLIQKNLQQFCNVKLLSARLGVSREHLSRVFRKETGQAPYRYIQRQKMLAACRLLKETRLTQKEIAFKMGYNVPAHFTRAFRRVMHLPPRRFRAVGMIPVQ